MREFVLKAANRKKVEDADNWYRRVDGWDDDELFCDTTSRDGRVDLNALPTRDRFTISDIGEDVNPEDTYIFDDVDMFREHLPHNWEEEIAEDR